MTADERIDDLEYRLKQYHEWLVDSIAERDRLAIDAAWGVHYVLYNALGTAAALYAVYHFFGRDGWLAGTLDVVLLLVVPVLIHFWSNGARMKEVERFAKLPDWQIKVG